MFCLSLDIDWAPDEVIRDSLKLISAAGARATWFVTHETPVLDEIAATPGQQLGLHPNFNPALQGNGKSANETIRELLEIVPGARVVRSHSLTRSNYLSAVFSEAGLTHESNIAVHPRTAQGLAPWRCKSGLVQVPVFWGDDLCMADGSYGTVVDWIGKVPVLTVYFHPMHIFINTVGPEDYERIKPSYKDVSALLAARKPDGSDGVRDRFLDLLERLPSVEQKLITEIY
jgi:hypothetical protein